METAALLRYFQCSASSISYAWPSVEKTGLAAWPISHNQALTAGRLATFAKQGGITVSCAKTPEATVPSKFDGSREKHGLQGATFPSAFEALVLEVCDETNVAELQLKVGDFEMLLKRNIGGTSAPIAVAPPVPTEPMVQSTPATPLTSSPKPPSEKANPFVKASSAVSSKLARLEASGTDGFKLVTSPTVGTFRRGRTVKEKKQHPICKQGDIIKEGQVIGYIDQFGSESPLKSDVAGEVLKFLFDEGDAVGYGDPIVAVLPSFHGLN